MAKRKKQTGPTIGKIDALRVLARNMFETFRITLKLEEARNKAITRCRGDEFGRIEGLSHLEGLLEQEKRYLEREDKNFVLIEEDIAALRGFAGPKEFSKLVYNLLLIFDLYRKMKEQIGRRIEQEEHFIERAKARRSDRPYVIKLLGRFLKAWNREIKQRAKLVAIFREHKFDEDKVVADQYREQVIRESVEKGREAAKKTGWFVAAVAGILISLGLAIQGYLTHTELAEERREKKMVERALSNLWNETIKYRAGWVKRDDAGLVKRPDTHN